MNIFCNQIFTPAGAVSTFQQDTWNPHSSGIVVSSAGSIHRCHQIVHMCDLCHLTALCRNFRSSCPCTIYIGYQPLEAIPAMQIDIIIYLREKLCHNSISDPVTKCTIRISRKNSVQILSVFIRQAHGAMLKSRPVHQTDYYDISRNLLRIQIVSHLHGCLNTYIFRIMYSAGNQNCFPFLFSTDKCYWNSEISSYDMHKSGHLFPWLRLQVCHSQCSHSVFSSISEL